MSLGASEQPIFSIYDGLVESINFINPIVGVVIIIRHDKTTSSQPLMNMVLDINGRDAEEIFAKFSIPLLDNEAA